VHCIARPSGAHNVIGTWNSDSGVTSKGVPKKNFKEGLTSLTGENELKSSFSDIFSAVHPSFLLRFAV